MLFVLSVACSARVLPSQPAHSTDITIAAASLPLPVVDGPLRPASAQVLTRADDGHDPLGMVGRCRRSASDFGGYSGLEWVDGHLLAVSDRGHLLWMTVTDADDGVVVQGHALAELGSCGAEAVRRAGDGLWLVYEESRRVEHYHPSHGTLSLDTGWQDGLRYPDPNEGMEAMAVLPDGRLLLLASGRVGGVPEDQTMGRLISAQGQLQGTLTLPLRHEAGVPYTPTELVVTTGGRLLLLERSWHQRQNRALISEIPVEQLHDGAMISPTVVARLGPEQPIDNMEGLAIEPHPDGDRLWMISDDNPQAATGQRVLLFSFWLEDDR